MTKLFSIGGFCFSLSYPEELSPPKNFMLFEVSEGSPEYCYRILLTDKLPAPEGEVIARREDIRIFRHGNLENRLLGIKGYDGYYAYYEELSDTEARIWLVPDYIVELNIDPVFSSLLALERRLSIKNALILHCAYVKYKDEAILFSAPSETGKTTQANLWEKHAGSKTVNGDRALLRCVDGKWCACGWPVCGTSDVCNNLTTPIRAIVMLSQSTDNRAEALPPAEAFRLLYSQITVNTWNRDFVQKNMDLIESLAGAVPVCHLSCNISEDAVKCLHHIIYDN